MSEEEPETMNCSKKEDISLCTSNLASFHFYTRMENNNESIIISYIILFLILFLNVNLSFKDKNTVPSEALSLNA